MGHVQMYFTCAFWTREAPDGGFGKDCYPYVHIHSDHPIVTIRVPFVNNVRRCLHADAEFRAGQEQASLSGADVSQANFCCPALLFVYLQLFICA
jgi:hypothetical protein